MLPRRAATLDEHGHAAGPFPTKATTAYPQTNTTIPHPQENHRAPKVRDCLQKFQQHFHKKPTFLLLDFLPDVEIFREQGRRIGTRVSHPRERAGGAVRGRAPAGLLHPAVRPRAGRPPHRTPRCGAAHTVAARGEAGLTDNLGVLSAAQGKLSL